MALSSPLCIAARLSSGVVPVEERILEKRWHPFISTPSLSLIRRTRTSNRKGQVKAQLLDWAEAKTSQPKSTSYVVKEGDTLTSIARQSKTSVRILAEVNNITNVDILLAGQSIHLPNEYDSYERPGSQAVGDDEFPTPRGLLSPQESSEASEGGARLWRRVVQNVERIDSGGSSRVYPPLNIPMLAIPILLIAPVLGFCIRCIVDTVYLQVDREDAEQRTEMEAWEVTHRPRAQRWQKILEADRDSKEESDSSNPDLSPARGGPTGADAWSQDATVRETNRESTVNETDEEIKQRHTKDYEDIRNSYAELESSYMKFLVDSGMSKSGYWRGSGMSTSARLDDSERG